MKLIANPDWQEVKGKAKVEKAIDEELLLWDAYVEGEFILGDEITLVDVAVFPILHFFYIHDHSCLDRYPKLKQFHKTFSTRSSVQSILSETPQ